MQRRSFFAVVCGVVASFFFPQKKAEAIVDSLSTPSKSVMLGLKGSEEVVDKAHYKICDFCGGEATNMHVGSKLTGHVDSHGSRWATWESTKTQFVCDGCEWHFWLQDKPKPTDPHLRSIHDRMAKKYKWDDQMSILMKRFRGAWQSGLK